MKCERERTWVNPWMILVDVGQKTMKFCKAIILQLKNKVQKKNHLAYGVSVSVA